MQNTNRVVSASVLKERKSSFVGKNILFCCTRPKRRLHRIAYVVGLLLYCALLGHVTVSTINRRDLYQRDWTDIIAQPDDSSSRIPCLIHRSWRTKNLPSARARRWHETWLKCMPDCRHVLWTDEDNRRLIVMHYQWLLPVYDRLKSGVQKADLARYVYMLHYGGIYTDIDTVCLRDFRHLLKPWSLVFGGMDGHWIRSVNGTYVQNSFMASEAGHPFWLGLLHRIFRQHRKADNQVDGPEESTGPLILMKELQQYIDSGQNDVRIFAPELFNPFSWITNRKKECKTHGGMSDEEESVCVASFPNAFVVQMHSKSWGGGKA